MTKKMKILRRIPIDKPLPPKAVVEVENCVRVLLGGAQWVMGQQTFVASRRQRL